MSLCAFTLNLETPKGGTIYDNASVVFELMNYGSAPPQTTTDFILPTKYTFYPNSSGLVSDSILRNDGITPTTTYWQLRVYFAGVLSYICDLVITTATLNINTATCLSEDQLPA